MKPEQGRPENESGRTGKEIRVYDLLDSLQIEYWRIDHDEVNTMEGCREIDDALDAVICKNLFLCNRNKSKFYLLMLPGEKKLDTKVLSSEIGSSRLSFADEKYMEQYLDITPGSVSIMGLMNDKNNNVKLLVDKDILAGEFIGCHPCVNTSSLKLKISDLFEKVLPAMNHDMQIVEIRAGK